MLGILDVYGVKHRHFSNGYITCTKCCLIQFHWICAQKPNSIKQNGHGVYSAATHKHTDSKEKISIEYNKKEEIAMKAYSASV